MSVVFSYDDFDPCDLMWVTRFAGSDGSGIFNILWQSQIQGVNAEWIAWSITTDTGANGNVTIQVGGDNIINGFGWTDGTIYSPANMPQVAPNMPVQALGNTVPGIQVFLNVLIRRLKP